MAKKLGFVEYNNKFSVNEKVRKVIDSLIETGSNSIKLSPKFV